MPSSAYVVLQFLKCSELMNKTMTSKLISVLLSLNLLALLLLCEAMVKQESYTFKSCAINFSARSHAFTSSFINRTRHFYDILRQSSTNKKLVSEFVPLCLTTSSGVNGDSNINKYQHKILDPSFTIAINTNEKEVNNIDTAKLSSPSIFENIKFVGCDVDGTLLRHDNTVSSRVLSSIRSLLHQNKGLRFFLATGKSRIGAWNALKDLKKDFSEKSKGGVFLQGLLVYNNNGEVIFERLLPNSMVIKVLDFCNDNGLPVFAYEGDSLITPKYDKEGYVLSITDYKEPIPEEVKDLRERVRSKKHRIHKLIIISSPSIIEKTRPLLETFLKLQGNSTTSIPDNEVEQATVTQAMDNMLEVLPFGASKGNGVIEFLKDANANPEELLAIGDGENDIEMLQLAKCGIAMRNATPLLKDIADFITRQDNNNDGASEIFEALYSFHEN